MEQRIGEGKSAFVINDRRGERKAPREEVVAVEEPVSTEDKSFWKDVSYLIVQAAIPQPGGQQVVVNLIRACGERSDGKPFLADWVMPPYWEDESDPALWTSYARKRLDTFLNCNCTEGGEFCTFHKDNLPQWGKQDMDRMSRQSIEAMPSSLELIIRAEQSAQSKKIVKPRR